ncbi:replication-relaxation family protein [Paenibacillus sp. 1P07SE]|uniref:replication-relaxation family protein n=1 Tax=Paenibacillus sp. 1P07SE TaxID=3132209 RepID=UPI0039A67039
MMKKEIEQERDSTVYLGKREQDLLLLLYDMLFLDMDFIHRYIFPDQVLGSVHRKVRKLEDGAYIQSMMTPRVDGETAKNIKVITLNRLGVEEVDAMTGECRWDSRWTKRTPTFIHHLLQTAKVRGALQAQSIPEFQFQQWISERHSYYQYGQRKEDVIVPDGTAVFRRRQNEKEGDFIYFMEMERSRQRATVSQNKLRRYNDYIAREAFTKHAIFSLPPVLFRVNFISASENEKNRLMEHTANVDTSKIQAVMYTTYEELLANPYGDIWSFKGSDKKYSMWRIRPEE